MEQTVADRHPVANPEQLLLSQEVDLRIRQALGQLNPRERLVFELRHYQGLKLTTIATILETSEATARNALFRATGKLRRALADLMTATTAGAREVK